MIPFKIKVTKGNCRLALHVLEMDERLRNKGEIFDNGDMGITSINLPWSDEERLYLRGCWREADEADFILRFSTNHSRDAYLFRLQKLCDDFKAAWKRGEIKLLEAQR